MTNTLIEKKSLKNILQNYRVIIPEIQREYVWGDEDIGKNVLLPFLTDIIKQYEIYESVDNEFNIAVEENLKKAQAVGVSVTREAIQESLKPKFREKCKTDMGFLYTYLPPYFENKTTQTFKPCYLIDGQQRFTTLSLILLYVAVKENRIQEFSTLFWQKADNGNFYRPAFDFKVRQATHDFLQTLAEKACKNDHFEFDNISSMTWFLDVYSGDITINSMVNTIKKWNKKYLLLKEQKGSLNFFPFIMDNIFFWFFQVQDTIQGEELYITMNGRGKNLTDTEIIKATIFQNNPTNTEIGRVWEDIYDFFWEWKVEGEVSADKGVDKFFNWLYILNFYEKNNQLKEFSNDIDAETFCLTRDMFSLPDGISALDIKDFGNTLRLLKKFSAQHSFVGFGYNLEDIVRSCDNKKFMRGCFLVLPVLRWIKKQPSSSIDIRNLIRICRYLLNFATIKNISRDFSRSLWSAFKVVDSLAGSGDIIMLLDDTTRQISESLFSEEERKKLLIYRKNPIFREKLENLFWEIEDYKSSKIKSPDESYSINNFIDAIWEKWNTSAPTISEGDISKIENTFGSFKLWVEQIDSNPDAVYQWLLFPTHRGYYQRGSKISSMSICQIMEQKNVIIEIIKFVDDLQQNHIDFSAAFEIEEKQFLRDNWPQRAIIQDIFLQLAIYISLCRLHPMLQSGLAIDTDYNQFGIWNQPPHDLFPQKTLKVFFDSQKPYCFRSLSKNAQSWQSTCGTYILSCHIWEDDTDPNALLSNFIKSS